MSYHKTLTRLLQKDVKLQTETIAKKKRKFRNRIHPQKPGSALDKYKLHNYVHYTIIISKEGLL